MSSVDAGKYESWSSGKCGTTCDVLGNRMTYDKSRAPGCKISLIT